jgi:hypothetical protein
MNFHSMHRTGVAAAFGLLLGFGSTLHAESSFIVSELEKTGPSQGYIQFTLKTTAAASALGVELKYDPKQIRLSEPGSIQVVSGSAEDFSLESNVDSPGDMRVVLSSPKLRKLASGISFRVPVQSSVKGAVLGNYLPVAVSNIELSDLEARSAAAKLGTTVRLQGLTGGDTLNGKAGIRLGLDILKDETSKVKTVEYFADGVKVQTSTGVSPVTWTPKGSGSFELSARVTQTDGTVVTARAMPVVVTGLATAPFKGSYSGVVSDRSGAFASAATGEVQVLTTALGSYSVRLTLNGETLTDSGKFGAESVGVSSIVSKASKKTVRLRFQQEAKDISDKISGIVTDGTIAADGTPKGGTFASKFTARRNVWTDDPKKTVELAGKYTVAASPAGTPGSPKATGAVTVGSTGTVVGLFSHADGTRVTQSGFISKEGIWETYASLYKAAGFLTGSIDFSDRDRGVAGDMVWRTGAKSVADLDVSGSSFKLPASGLVLPVKSGAGNVKLEFAGGPLSQTVSKTVTLGARNTVTIPSADAQVLSLKLDPSNGTFTGSLRPSAKGLVQPFSGVLLQNGSQGVGYLGSGVNTGWVRLDLAR